MAKKTVKTGPKTGLSNWRRFEPLIWKLFLVGFGIYLSFFAMQFIRNYKIDIKPRDAIDDVEQSKEVAESANTTPRVIFKMEPRPKYWFYMGRGYMWIFFSIDNVLKKLGLEKIEMDVDHTTKIHMDWDLLWSYDYHNEIPIPFEQLKYYQKINHIPGNFVLCMKDNFAVNTDSKFIPKAFNNTESLKKYAAEHPNTRYVQKLWSNRGVELKEIDEINFDLFGPGYKYFAQVYIEKPLLIEGYKFDFGIYVLVTSINPLRVYMYNKNTLIRLCEQKYDPDNHDDIDSYVISDACLFPWDIDALSIYYNQSYTYKEAMNAYFKKRGYDMSIVWKQVEECIAEILTMKEYSFIEWSAHYPYKYSFFELYRFDFILDEALNLHLIEINQSPNVNPSEKLYRDRRMFENLLFDSFTLLGIGKYIKKKTFEFGDDLEEAMNCHDESLTVLPEVCVNKPCNETCDPIGCELCFQCLSRNEKHDLHLAYRENKHRGAMKRVFPPTMDALVEYGGEEYLQTLSPANQKHARWYIEMCEKDFSFC